MSGRGPIEVHIAELVVSGVPVVHEERLGPAVEAALSRRLGLGVNASPQPSPPRELSAVTPEALADTIAAAVHDAIRDAGGAS
jgi:hypothetical protein